MSPLTVICYYLWPLIFLSELIELELILNYFISDCYYWLFSLWTAVLMVICSLWHSQLNKAPSDTNRRLVLVNCPTSKCVQFETRKTVNLHMRSVKLKQWNILSIFAWKMTHLPVTKTVIHTFFCNWQIMKYCLIVSALLINVHLYLNC